MHTDRSRHISTADASMISVEHLTKNFVDLQRGSVVALDNATFDVQPGEVFGRIDIQEDAGIIDLYCTAPHVGGP